jgi:cellobiose phosphorylase
VKRVYRGATYHITVKNPAGANSGVEKLMVNGKSVTGNTIPIQAPGTTVDVEVLLGNKVAIPA